MSLCYIYHPAQARLFFRFFPLKKNRTAPQNPQAVQTRGHHSRRSSPTAHLSLDLPRIPDSPPASSMPTQTTTTTDDAPPSPPESKLTVKPKSQAHLITPPLTPSSSLKSDSSGGGGGGGGAAAAETTNVEHVPVSRFLVVSPAYLHVRIIKYLISNIPAQLFL